MTDANISNYPDPDEPMDMTDYGGQYDTNVMDADDMTMTQAIHVTTPTDLRGGFTHNPPFVTLGSFDGPVFVNAETGTTELVPWNDGCNP